MPNLSGIRSLRLLRDQLRSRLAALLDETAEAFAARSDSDQELRLDVAERVAKELRGVDHALDVELDRLLVDVGASNFHPRIVAMAAGRFVPGEAVATEGGFRNVCSMMPVAVLRNHVAHLQELVAQANDPQTMDELSGRLEVAIDEELARAAGQPSPKPQLPPVATRPVMAGGDGLQMMTGGPMASAGGAMHVSGPGRFTDMRDFAHEPGIMFARLAKLCAVSRGNVFEAQHHARVMYPHATEIHAALQQGTSTLGGFLIPEQASAEMIELLRNRTVIRPNSRVVPFKGTMTLPVQTSGVAATWLGESVDDLAQDVTFGQRRLVAKKLRALVAMSNELVRNSAPSADAFIREELVRALASGEDLAFLRGDGVGATPKGLRNWCPTAGAVATTGTTAAQIEADLTGMAQRLAAGMKGQLGSPRWLMPSRSFYKFYGLSDSNGALMFEEIQGAEPRLLGNSATITDVIPTNLTPGTATEIYLVDFSQVIIGADLAITAAVSDVASYKDAAGVMQSTFSRDEVALRAIMSVDLIVARDECLQVLTGATW